MPGIVLAEVMNWEKVHIQVYLEQESAIRVKEGQEATLSFESLRGHTYKAKVEKIYPSNGQFLVRLIPEEIPEGILPEMTTDLAIQVAKKENIILVPLKGVENGRVLRLRNGKKEKIEISSTTMDLSCHFKLLLNKSAAPELIGKLEELLA